MSIKSTLAGMVERHDSATDGPDAIDRRLAPYTVTTLSTEPSIPESGGLSTPLKLVVALLAGLLTAILAAGAGSTLSRRRAG